MSQRAALLISTALTVLTLLAGIGLGARAMSVNADAAPSSKAADSADASDADVDPDRQFGEALELVQASNTALAASYERISGLLDDVEQLRAQNAVLREREAQYQQRIVEANSRLQRQGQEAIALPPPAELGTASTSPTESIPSAASPQADATADALAAGPAQLADTSPRPPAAVVNQSASRSVASLPPPVVEPVAVEHVTAAPSSAPAASVGSGAASAPSPTVSALFAPGQVIPFEVHTATGPAPEQAAAMTDAPPARVEGSAQRGQSAVSLIRSVETRASAAVQPVNQARSPSSTRVATSRTKRGGHDGDDDKDDRDGRSESRERRNEHERD